MCGFSLMEPGLRSCGESNIAPALPASAAKSHRTQKAAATDAAAYAIHENWSR
jgi:hypothetical protein